MKKTPITMIDYGSSNLRSAYKAFEHIGAAVTVTTNPNDLFNGPKLVLPGVGAFGAGMDALRQQQLIKPIRAAVAQGIPLLGICVGMQFLFDSSDEMGNHDGLGLIPGTVTRFANNNGLKVPHMGWNQIIHKGVHPLLAHVESGTYAYFVHSYYCVPNDEAAIIAHTPYGRSFAAIVGSRHVYGLQFHPEKSQRVGLQIIKNYVEMKI